MLVNVKNLFLAAALLALGQPAFAQTQSPPVAEVTAEQWREDLRFMAAEMERRHANLYHTVSRERFAAAVADLDARIPGLQRNQIIVGMMRIAAMVGDGHTRIDPRKDPRFGFRSLPLKLYLFEDGLYVRAAAPEHAALVGAKVEAIGGVPVEEAIRRAAAISSRDNEIGPKLFVPLYLAMPDLLHALELGTSREAATLKLRKGKRVWTATVPSGAVDPIWPPDTDISLMTPEGWVDASTAPKPLWLQAPLDYHRLVELPEQKALYAQLNMVTNIAGQSLTEYGEKIGARARAANPRALILDLRLNQGGGGHLRNGLVRELIRAEDEDTRLFVLTWRGTFSASQFILDDLDRLSDAIIIGEPASSKPSSFGDAYRIGMPNSGIHIRSSIYYWQQGQNKDPWTWVDVATPLTFADYVAGRDPALEAALNYVPQPPLQEQLIAASKAGGPAAVREALHKYRTDPAHLYANLTLQIPRAAEMLWNGKHPEAALAAAEYGVEQFPDNVDAWNVLAHLAEAAKRTDIARKAGARVLELDPNSRTARALMERLAATS
jgi:tetratricopeptide (TPR) repeat protein